jgi:hypothetical protein
MFALVIPKILANNNEPLLRNLRENTKGIKKSIVLD